MTQKERQQRHVDLIVDRCNSALILLREALPHLPAELAAAVRAFLGSETE